ncbi:hypothetical protein CMI38_06315 [Candidatus Pacearchaeota archaeon]|jgi:hypothetical protein|nr:hypothetical protein [Candidatus Pacearchaeota archaeon]
MNIKFKAETFLEKYKNNELLCPEDTQLYHDSYRYESWLFMIEKMYQIERPICMVETGTSIAKETGSTYILGDFIKNHVGGKLITIDIDENRIESCKEQTKEFSDVIEYIHSDSVEYLKNYKGQNIDILHQDSYDLNLQKPWPSMHHHLKEIVAIYKKLSWDALVIVDDNWFAPMWVDWFWYDSDLSKSSRKRIEITEDIGKGIYVKFFLENLGWKCMSKNIPGKLNNIIMVRQ